MKDHLGSVRAIVNQNGLLSAQSDYFPFGDRWNSDGSATTNRYLFNGKEKQTANYIDNYVNLLDFGARMYDPVIPHWLTPDPLAETYYSYGPYNYCLGNPVKYIDPDGRKIVDAKGNLVYNNGQWTKYASQDHIRVGNMMMRTKTGTEQFQKMVDHDAPITLP